MNKENMFVPSKLAQYVKWGHFDTVEKIINSKQFYPMWVTGLAGNGKTQMIEQACAEAGREFIRVNFTMETDEHDLVGGFRLEKGDTRFHEGPVTQALRRGAILLLDEVDTANCNKVLCLQSIMEGKGILIKATGEFVKPAPGFNVFATSNTKGRGTEDGRFIGTNVMNAAFLDRFGGMLFQDYPPMDIEVQILQNYFVTEVWKDKTSKDDITNADKINAEKYITKLAEWARQIRESFANGSSEEVITTRSLIAIIKAFSIFGDKLQAIKMSCERYDESVRDGFVSLFEKMSDDNIVAEEAKDDDDDFISFKL